jgi:hypothetical protein
MMAYQSTLLAIAALAVLLFLLPRRYFLLPFILGAFFIPSDQRVLILTLDFTAVRILVLAGLLRTVLTGPRRRSVTTGFDKLVYVWAISGAAIYILQWASFSAVIYKSGVLFDIIGMYWLFRKNILGWDDILRLIKMFAICALVLCTFIIFEAVTGSNPFVFLGKVGTVVRDERLRCQGPFPHSIMLGLFCATLTPLLIGRAKIEGNSRLYWSAAAACGLMVILSASSTPLVVLMAVAAGVFAFNYRHHVPHAGMGAIVGLTALSLVMDAPVWHLISRINVVGGSTGWHRYNLIRQAINHVGEWMALGCRSTAHWGWGMQDVTNQYIFEGVRGGAITLLFFVMMLFFGLRAILDVSLKAKHPSLRWLSWCIFVSLAGHCLAFMGVTYFGQITMQWYMMLAVVGFLAEYQHALCPSAVKAYKPARLEIVTRQKTVNLD